MAWLHTWCGLVCGWLLCAIFLAGTLSVFRAPITRWMEARPVVPTTTTMQDTALQRAVEHLRTQAAGARLWRIELPQEPGDALLLAWPPAGGARGSLQRVALHPATGDLLPQPWGRATEGGRHFMSLHYTLHGGIPGFWLVGALSMGMLVALVSGVVVHRRIFVDFFTFRPGKGQRSWLDAHNAAGVLALPFLCMIAYTGLAIFYSSYLPWPLQAVYGRDDGAYGRFQQALAHDAALPRLQRTGQPATPHALAPLIAQAQQLTGRAAQMIVVEQPGDAAMRTTVHGRAPHDAPTLRNPGTSVTFDGATGVVLKVRRPEPDAALTSADVHHTLEALHMATFGGWTVKWLYFFSGLLGTALMATGTVLFAVKRRAKSGHEFGRATARFYRAVDALNVAALAGTAVACIAYLWLNRLLPAAWPERAVWEIRGFLLVWLCTVLHAACRPAQKAWVEQLGTAALLCLCVPLLNHWTIGQQLVAYALASDWQRAGVEITVLGFGTVLAGMALRVRRGPVRKAARPPRVPATAPHAAPPGAQP